MMRSLFALFAVTACGSSPTPSDAGIDADAGPPPVVFGACPEGYFTECATLAEPLDHHDPSGETIDFMIARYPAPVQPAKRQVWLLAGGPGQAGYVYGKLVATFSARMPDADFFVADHRGTGHSHRLACPQQDVPHSYGGYNLPASQGAACLASMKASGDYDRLAYFTSAQAAADVIDAIDRTRAPNEKVYVWGASYGTHWAHRILQQRPDGIDGFVFDGFLTPNHFSFLDYDRASEEAGEAFAAACDADASCTTHVGAGGALAKVQSVLAKLETSPCAGFDKSQARTLITLFLDSFFARALLFPTIHRLERCNTDDQTALGFLVGAYNDALNTAYDIPYVNSGVLQLNIVMSELWGTPGEQTPPKTALDAAANAQAFLAVQSLPGSLVALRAIWPLPPDDYSSLPVPVATSSKLLWLGAAMDAHAFPSQGHAIASVYPSAPYVEPKDAAHVPSRQSPLDSAHTDDCGMHVVTAFVENDGALDLSCEPAMLPAVFEAPNAAFATKWWNTTNDWGD